MREARFGPFRLDLLRRELWQGDTLVPIGARALGCATRIDLFIQVLKILIIDEPF